MIDIKRIETIDRLVKQVVSDFNEGDWLLLATYLGDLGSIITNHSRLLRSMSWGDDDYPSCVASVLGQVFSREPDAVKLVEKMLSDKGSDKMPAAQDNSSGTACSGLEIDASVVAVMIPFRPEFDDVRNAMGEACRKNGLTLKAADDVWEDSILIKDILNLIRTSCIVIVDFTGKNPNVMYETGVAHALGKEVIPVTQAMEDVPFDVRHFRALEYKNNETGRRDLENRLAERIDTILKKNGWCDPFKF